MSDLILIGMRDERAPLGLLEDKREGIERPGRAHPGELVGTNVDLGLEMLDVFVTKTAVDAVSQHHQVGVGKAGLVIDVGFEQQVDAEFARPLLQDQQQLAARAAAKTVAADPVHAAAEVHGDIVPIGEFLGDAAVARGVVLFEIIQRRIRKHHAEAKGVVGAVALIDRDLGLRPLLFQQDRGVETRRSTPDDRDLHGKPPAPRNHFADYFKPKAIFRQGRTYLQILRHPEEPRILRGVSKDGPPEHVSHPSRLARARTSRVSANALIRG